MQNFKALVRNSSRILPVFALTLTATLHSAYASMGGTSSGGGDTCEDRIKIIRDDLKAWIQNGGPSGLSLPAGIPVQQYSEAMLASIDSTKVRCVAAGDPGFPVTINGTPKACRFDLGAPDRITCDFVKFSSLSGPGQYVLIHHELAGIAGMEIPKGDDSNYEISNQISEYLVSETVNRLAIKKPLNNGNESCGGKYETYWHDLIIQNYESEGDDAEKFLALDFLAGGISSSTIGGAGILAPGGLWLSTGLYEMNQDGKDKASEKITDFGSSLQLLRDAYIGGGLELTNFTRDVINKTRQYDLSPAYVAKLIVSLDGQSEFCHGYAPDDWNAILEKIAERLK